ncbi:MAG: BlaI/MecI/CopY family transcriptional regulator [Eisenbergiella massiliensis]
MHRSFGNSLPAFVAAFLRDKKLTRQEAEELKRLIDAASMSDGRNDS